MTIEVFADIQTLLASRASEELFLQTRLNGVGGDLHRATQLALHYVAHWGMGEGFFSASELWQRKQRCICKSGWAR